MQIYNVIDVSSYIINYSNQINHPINNLKLQKLLYYVQAAMLIEVGRKCFNSKIIAWKFGPAIPEAYRFFEEYGRNNIPTQEGRKTINLDDNTLRMIYSPLVEIDYTTKMIIRNVVDSYLDITNPLELSKKTRREDPWKTTPLNQEIICSEISKYYKKQPRLIYECCW